MNNLLLAKETNLKTFANASNSLFIVIIEIKMSKNMKIMFLAGSSYAGLTEWVKYFVTRDCEVHWVTFSTLPPEPIKKVKTHQIVGTYNILSRVRYLRKVIKKINPDIVHAFHITSYGIPAALSCFHPLVLSALGSDIAIEPEKSRKTEFLVKFILKKAVLVHTGHETGRKRLVELGCNKEKIFVQPFGVEVNEFSPDSRSQSLRRELNIENKYSVIIAHRWKRKYRIDVFIKAIPMVLEKIQDVKFLICGGGFLEQELKELVIELGVHKNVEFIGDIPHSEMHKYLASVDLYVDTLSDYRDGVIGKGGGEVGVTTMEAMACGTPQLISDRVSVRSGNWFQGLTYRQLDSQDMAEKILLLLRNESLRKEIGRKSRKMALRIGNLEKNMRSWQGIYHSLC